jgi:hypothetical protein
VEVRSDCTFHFDVGSEALWSAITDVGHYRRWWPWLRRFDGAAFSEGARWRCVVRSPLRYRVRFDVVLDEVFPGRSATASVTGDIAGHARLDVRADDGGGADDRSRLHLVSRLEPRSRLLRSLSLVAPPVARFGHDRLLRTGVRQFSARALGG